MHENMSTTQKQSTIPPVLRSKEEELGEQPLQQTRWEPLHESGDYNNAFKWPGEFTVLMDSPEKMLALIRPALDVNAGISLIAQFILYTGIINEYLIYLSFAADKHHQAQREKWTFDAHEELENVRNEIREARGRVCDFATPARIAREYAAVLQRVKDVMANPETGPGRLLEAMRGEEPAQAFAERFRLLYEQWHGPEGTASKAPTGERPRDVAQHDPYQVN